MAEIIEILSTQGEERQTFTVDTSQDFVTLNPEIAPITEFPFYSAFHTKEKFFKPNDSIRILSMGITLPYNFQLAQDNVFLSFLYKSKAPVTVRPVNVGGNQGYMCLPFANYETALDVFVPYPSFSSGVAVSYQCLIMSPTTTARPEQHLKISMVGVPAAFNGKTFPVTVFIKVLHSLAMIA